MKLLVITTTPANEQCIVSALSSLKLSSFSYPGGVGPLRDKGVMIVAPIEKGKVKDAINKLKISCVEEGEVVEPPAPEAQAGEFLADSPIEIQRQNTKLYVLSIDAAHSW